MKRNFKEFFIKIEKLIVKDFYCENIAILVKANFSHVFIYYFLLIVAWT
jgi:hypothetical protein